VFRSESRLSRTTVNDDLASASQGTGVGKGKDLGGEEGCCTDAPSPRKGGGKKKNKEKVAMERGWGKCRPLPEGNSVL